MSHRAHWNAELECASKQAIARLHNEKLAQQLAYVAVNSAFYQRKFAVAKLDVARIRETQALAELPFTESWV